jgi:protein arginine kinase activator
MLCDSCKKNEANVHITRIINGVKYDTNLCDKCAKESEEFNFNTNIEFASPFTFQNILSGIMDYISDTKESEKRSDIVCNNCGTTFNEFREKGLFGCGECYENFSSSVIPIIKRVQGNTEHMGKIPKKLGKSIIQKNKLLKLKEDLQKSISTEEYEKAAEIRDKIKEIEKENK